MVIEVLKEGARKRARAQRAKAHERAQVIGSAQAAQLLSAFLTPHYGKVIAGYMPIGTEIDPRPAMMQLSKKGEVCVPVVLGKGQALRFDRWTPETQMVEGAFGAAIPQVSEPIVPEVVILPMLAFDRKGNRLGYGGGFYDRSLAALRAKGDVFAIGLAYAGQELPELPTEHTDAPLDALVTEQEVLSF